MPESIVFKLVPEQGHLVRFDAFEAAIVEMRKLIRDVDRAVRRAEGGAFRDRRWFIQRLSSSDPTIGLIAEDIGGHVHTDRRLLDGVTEITGGDGDSPPAFFSEQELNSLIALKRRVLSKDINHLALGQTAQDTPVNIYPSIEDRVNRILGKSVQALGSLDGELDAINSHKSPYFTMWESMSGQPVKCHFEMKRLEEVKSFLHRGVRVSGLITYFANGKPRAINRIELLRDTGSPDQPARRRSFWASVPRLAEGRDTVAYLKEAYGDS